MFEHLVIGNGEIGKSVGEVFNCDVLGRHEEVVSTFGEPDHSVLHICFPFSEVFVGEVFRYKDLYKPRFVVIHSTVPVGTSRICGAIHTPVIGIHPHLAESLKTFTKFLGGPDAHLVAHEFRRAGMKVYLFDAPETTELMKILDTTFYGVCIEYTKDVKKQCETYDVPFEAWTLWTESYNKGYQKLGYPEYTRPNLIPIQTAIGGHCVRPNLELLATKFTEFLKGL